MDRVIGRGRCPTWEDKDGLPFLEAYIKEGFRWRPMIAGGLVHGVTEDIIYENFIIPKGADIIGNHWCISHDPLVFPSPDDFDPSHFLVPTIDPETGKERLTANELQHFTFGFGRRACAGKEIANRSLWITTAFLLWSFNITHATDEEGVEIPIESSTRKGFTGGQFSKPLPFRVRLEERGEGEVRREMSDD